MVQSRAASDLERVETEDGSVTYRLVGTPITYRSVHGARTEAEHVFVHSTGLGGRTGTWRVLELGFGLGTNFMATAKAAERAGVSLEFFSVEHALAPTSCFDPGEPFSALAQDVVARVRDGAFEARGRHGAVALHLFGAGWLDPGWTVDGAHALYFDPFGPKVEPGSWTLESFQRARACLAPDGVLSTYSAAVRVKRSLAQAGMFVACAPGPPFKNEITLASPSEAALLGHPIVERPGS